MGVWKPAVVLMSGVILSCVLWGEANATLLTVPDPFLRLENNGINSIGGPVGQLIRVGATSVVPSGGTTGFASTTNTLTVKPFGIPIYFAPSPKLPNFFSGLIGFDPNLLGPWTISFRNPGYTNFNTSLSFPVGASEMPFVQSITLSGSALNPTFTWTPPPATVVNGYRLNIVDKSLIGPGNTGQVTSINVRNTITSYTVKSSDFTVPGYNFTTGKNYSLQISALETRDGSSTNLTNNNVYALSRVYADFTPSSAGGPAVNLPVTLISGAYQFNVAVVPGTTYYFDPAVAVGYDFAIGAGNPDFASVILPNVGDGIFSLSYKDGATTITTSLDAGVQYFFLGGGVGAFHVGGIETSAGLDPTNTTAFVTGLTFNGSGQFTGTQTPIVADVPEPGILAIFGLSVLGMGMARQRRSVR